MLNKHHRLPGNQIPKVVKKGKNFSSPLFNLVIYPRPTTHDPRPTNRFAFVISSKISKKAVVRNRTKRLLSEAVRLLMPQIKKGHDIIFFAKRSLEKEKLQDVLPVVEKGLKKARLLV